MGVHPGGSGAPRCVLLVGGSREANGVPIAASETRPLRSSSPFALRSTEHTPERGVRGREADQDTGTGDRTHPSGRDRLALARARAGGRARGEADLTGRTAFATQKVRNPLTASEPGG